MVWEAIVAVSVGLSGAEQRDPSHRVAGHFYFFWSFGFQPSIFDVIVSRTRRRLERTSLRPGRHAYSFLLPMLKVIPTFRTDTVF
jgi:hypothetical protein